MYFAGGLALDWQVNLSPKLTRCVPFALGNIDVFDGESAIRASEINYKLNRTRYAERYKLVTYCNDNINQV